MTAVAARARRDDAALRLALAAGSTTSASRTRDLLRQAVARHAWVQVLKGDVWIDLDPTLRRRDRWAKRWLSRAVPPTTSHRSSSTPCVVRVIAETLADGKLSETVSLERELPSRRRPRQYLLLAFLPEESKGAAAAGGTTSPTRSCRLSGGRRGAGRPDHRDNGGRAVERASAPSSAATRSSGGELAGLFIEIETRVPGRRPTVARHVLLDRVPPDARSASSSAPTRSSALLPMAACRAP